MSQKWSAGHFLLFFMRPFLLPPHSPQAIPMDGKAWHGTQNALLLPVKPVPAASQTKL